MRDPGRIKPILDRLEKVWSAHPDLRLSQLIMNLESDERVYRLYSLEDDDLVNNLEAFYKGAVNV